MYVSSDDSFCHERINLLRWLGTAHLVTFQFVCFTRSLRLLLWWSGGCWVLCNTGINTQTQGQFWNNWGKAGPAPKFVNHSKKEKRNWKKQKQFLLSLPYSNKHLLGIIVSFPISELGEQHSLKLCPNFLKHIWASRFMGEKEEQWLAMSWKEKKVLEIFTQNGLSHFTLF